MAFSHELIHHIAGTHDTNQNLTRRLLLLFESVSATQARGASRDFREGLEEMFLRRDGMLKDLTLRFGVF